MQFQISSAINTCTMNNDNKLCMHVSVLLPLCFDNSIYYFLDDDTSVALAVTLPVLLLVITGIPIVGIIYIVWCGQRKGME